MTPQERRALLDRLQADLGAEIAKAEADLKPVAEQCGRLSNRLSRLRDQRQRILDGLNWFQPSADDVVLAAIEGTASVGMAEADLDDVLHGR